MESAAETQQAGIGQFFNPEVLLDKLSQEFERLDTEWNKTRSHNGKLVHKKLVLSEKSYLVDLQKTKQVIDMLVDVLGSYFEVPLFELEGSNVVVSHPAFEQLSALSVNLHFITPSKSDEDFPYWIIEKGNKFNHLQKLHLSRFFKLVDRIKEDSDIRCRNYNKEKGRNIVTSYTTEQACEIICKNVKIEFKGKTVRSKKLKQLYDNHHPLMPAE